jgi:hypothetical protein
VQSQNDLPVVEAIVVEQVGTMDAFEKDGVIVLQQPVEKLTVGAGANDIGQPVRESLMAFVAGVVVDLYAVFFQYRLRAAAVFKAVQMDLYAGVKERPDLMEQVEDSPVIYGVRHVQAHDM